MDIRKPWHQMSAEEREAARKMRLVESGGAECDGCGREDYEQNLTLHTDGKLYCDDCCGELGIEQ